MKKGKGKYIILGILAIILVLIAVNWGNIKILIGIMSNKTESDINAEKIELDEIKNPLLDIIEEDKKDGKDSSPDNKDNADVKKGDNTTESNPDKDQLYTEILTKYNNKFETLQNDFEGQLDAMVREGYEEYKNGNVSKMKLAGKYMSMSQSLENESDANFNQVLKEMENELKDNGLDSDIAKDVGAYYKNYKEKKKIDILSKGSKVK